MTDEVADRLERLEKLYRLAVEMVYGPHDMRPYEDVQAEFADCVDSIDPHRAVI